MKGVVILLIIMTIFSLIQTTEALCISCLFMGKENVKENNRRVTEKLYVDSTISEQLNIMKTIIQNILYDTVMSIKYSIMVYTVQTIVTIMMSIVAYLVYIHIIKGRHSNDNKDIQ